MLIHRGADVTAQNKDGETPLHLALYWGNAGVARMLVEHGVGVTAQNKEGVARMGGLLEPLPPPWYEFPRQSRGKD